MSIKIYNAYRIRKQHCYWDVLMKIQDKARKNMKATLRKTYTALVENWKAHPEEFAAAHQLIWGKEVPVDKQPTVLFARDFVQRSYGMQLNKGMIDTFDLDVSVSVRRVKKRYLLIAYPGSGLFWDCLKFMEKMPELEDFHYQNQADAPYEYDPKSKITPRMWRERRDTWKPILDEPKWSEMLVLDICSYGAFTKVDPWFDDLLAAAKIKDKEEHEKFVKEQLGG